jgi:hypothetical protein
VPAPLGDVHRVNSDYVALADECVQHEVAASFLSRPEVDENLPFHAVEHAHRCVPALDWEGHECCWVTGDVTPDLCCRRLRHRLYARHKGQPAEVARRDAIRDLGEELPPATWDRLLFRRTA